MATTIKELPEPPYPSPTRGRPSYDAESVEPRAHSLSLNLSRSGNGTDATIVHNPQNGQQGSSDEEGTFVAEGTSNRQYEGQRQNTQRGQHYLTVQTVNSRSNQDPLSMLQSPSQAREQANRLNDDLRLLQVEREVSDINREDGQQSSKNSVHRSRSRRAGEAVDEFDVATNPLHEKAAIYRPPELPDNAVAKFFKAVHGAGVFIRYFVYIIPVVLILLIPLLLGALLFKNASVGGVQLVWFMIWLEIFWLTLWAGRILAKLLPWPVGLATSLFTNNAKKWRDMGKQLEIPATIFFWWLGLEISFLPTMVNHHVNGNTSPQSWEDSMNKVIITLFVGAVLNLVEKIIIQLIAISFHLRTYEDRIVINKFQIGSLTKLYHFSKEKIAMDDSEFEDHPFGLPPGVRTPGQAMERGQKVVREGFAKFGDVAGRVAADFTGRQTVSSTHPRQVVLALLRSTSGGQVLARRLYRTFVRPGEEVVSSDDLRNAFDNDEEAEAAFTMFDKDMNGDISMEELEAVCVEIGRERKSITASLKDLDSVVGKLDNVFMFIVAVITILVFISLISTSAAGVLTSAGSTVLALSWLFSASAQEFLQSVIFVFVKHPFDVGDRVTVYGNTGDLGKGDDYFVKEISLLYTEFKKMQGHIVQAPNYYLNQLFILNQRRSGALAEAVPIIIKFGTTLEQIENLRKYLLDFVTSEEQRREYQGKILTELRDITEAHQITLNVVFFYKANWQNELLRLQRRNKFFCALMVALQELGIEGPRMRLPGQKEISPMYVAQVDSARSPWYRKSDNPPPFTDGTQDSTGEASFLAPAPTPNTTTTPQPTNDPALERIPTAFSRTGTASHRRESLGAMGRRLDFSLGVQEFSSGGSMAGDVYQDRERDDSNSRTRIPIALQSPSVSRPRGSADMPRDPRSSLDVGRTTSRSSGPGPFGLGRSMTDNLRTSGSVHRNRFFGKGSPSRRSNDEEKGLMAARTGRSGSLGAPPRSGSLWQQHQGVEHLARIPEVPGKSGSGEQSEKQDLAQEEGRGQGMGGMSGEDESGDGGAGQKMDPRSGIVSPLAWRLHSDDSIQPEPGPENPPNALLSGQVAGQGHGVVQEQDLEMRRLG